MSSSDICNCDAITIYIFVTMEGLYYMPVYSTIPPPYAGQMSQPVFIICTLYCQLQNYNQTQPKMQLLILNMQPIFMSIIKDVSVNEKIILGLEID